MHLHSAHAVDHRISWAHMVSMFSPLQPRDKMCGRGVCCCQQQHLRCGSCVQLQGGRYSRNPRCKCSSGKTAPAGTGSIAQDRTAGWHWTMCLLLFAEAGERNFSMALSSQLRALYCFFKDIAEEQLIFSLCYPLLAMLLPCTVAESFVTNLIFQEVKYKFLLYLEIVLEKANPMLFLFLRLSQHRPCSAGNLCSHCFPLS